MSVEPFAVGLTVQLLTHSFLLSQLNRWLSSSGSSDSSPSHWIQSRPLSLLPMMVMSTDEPRLMLLSLKITRTVGRTAMGVGVTVGVPGPTVGVGVTGVGVGVGPSRTRSWVTVQSERTPFLSRARARRSYLPGRVGFTSQDEAQSVRWSQAS